ncbi:MAG: hypothetical protein ACOX1O_02635 [Eggerthellaceae bacterium]|jgi:hypothetical protein
MSRKLVLHIGTHKTGTTAIQGAMGLNVPELKAQGYAYPLFSAHFKGVPNNRNGYFVARLVKDALNPGSVDGKMLRLAQTCRDAIPQYVEAPEDVILSDERLWYTARGYAEFWPKLRSIMEDLGFREFRIIVYLRRQDRFAEALWNQFVKGDTRMTKSLWEYINGKTMRRVCDYAKGLDNLAETFGKENLSVHVFDRARMKDGNVVPDFANAIGVDISQFAEPENKEVNVRLSNDAVEIKRLLNASETYASMRNFMHQTMLDISVAHPESNKTNILPAEKRKEFLARYEEGNAYVAREYLGIEDGTLFGPAKADEYPDWTPDSDSMREALVLTFEALVSQNFEYRKHIQDVLQQQSHDNG